MHDAIKIMRDKGMTWTEVAKSLDVSVSTAKRRFKDVPKFPVIHDARIYKKVINQRLIMVKLEDDQVVPAIKKIGFNYPLGQCVRVEQIDERHFRLV